jgi:S1-C subfamily serine protease/cbb3-type cytochrome oxidase subunit 3
VNPFPGLRPFEADEGHLFFGRDGQSDELLRRLGRTRFLAVVGTSGSGKSSLVRAGLLPSLAGGFMSTAGSGWRIALFRPGDTPIDNLAKALVARGVLSDDAVEPATREAIVEAALRRSALGLVEVMRQARWPPSENLLVVVDQFEELFRFRHAAGPAARDESAAFVKLLLEAARQRELPIYIVLTMRSDFIGECEQFRDLPEALNEGQYLVARMTRDQRREAIVGPAAVGQGRMGARLVQRLLNDVGDDPDQLPILQHALMRTWTRWEEQGIRRDLDVEDYEAIGAMADALSRHADEAYEELSAGGKRLAARIFKCLTTRGPNGQPIRRPATVARLTAATGGSVADVRAVIERFRAPGCSFLMPPVPAPLDDDAVVDISHESLIRQWGRLRVWAEEEAVSRALYLRVVDAAVRHERGEGGLWRDPDLKLALDWKAATAPNPAWAAFYDPGFESAMRFLAESQAEVEAERRERGRQRRLRVGTVATLVVLMLIVIMAVVAWIFSESERRAANTARALADEQRLKAEAALAVVDKARQQADAARAAADEQRMIADTQREAAQNARIAAEEQRQKAEAALATAERARVAAREQSERASREAERADKASDTVAQQERALADVFSTVRPSVVKLGSLTSAGPQFRATAFFASSSGLLVTAAHVTPGLRDDGVPLRRTDGSTISGRKVRVDTERDLALLQAPSDRPTACLRLADAEVRPGTRVIALGMSPTQEWLATSGKVTRTGVSVPIVGVPRADDFIQADMKIGPGFSGAPVLDTVTRRVVGIVVGGGQDSTQTFLIPTSRIRAAFGGELAAAPCAPAAAF